MIRTTEVFQIGGTERLEMPNLEPTFKFHFLALETPGNIMIAEDTLLKNGKLHHHLRNAIFILGKRSFIYMMPDLLIQLPANRILYEQSDQQPENIKKILLIKQAEAVDLTEINKVERKVNEEYFGGQDGSRLDFDKIEISTWCSSKVNQYGRGEIDIVNCQFLNFTQAINWRMTHALTSNVTMEFWPEFNLSGHANAIFKIYILNELANKVIHIYTVTAEQLKHPFYFKTNDQPTIMYVSVLLMGDVKHFTIRNIHIRRSRFGHGNYMVNSRMITDKENSRGQVAVYFDAGDMKPPLNVYFSGWRTAEGFEGNGIMGTVGGGGVPYLLIADERLEGGAFYIGSLEFENEVYRTIQTYLNKLGFSNEQLVLSGISMGTTAALYYASRLQPSAVIVGKPLINLGTIAGNERLRRPYGFPTSLDLLLLHEKATDEGAQTRLNQKFWNQFKIGDYSQTLFAIAYMCQDDYDKFAFSDLFTYLKKEYPLGQLLYKGLVGRHNDNTAGIVEWFMRQYENIMETRFDRSGK